MKNVISKFNCKEFFNDYYSRGVFHAGEAQILFPHDKIKIQDDYIVVGEVFDDHDFQICYRSDESGIWGKSNYDGTYQKVSNTLKELTRGWYQVDYNYWSSMTSDIALRKTVEYYEINMLRYDWNSQPFIRLLTFIINQNNNLKVFTKGFEKCLDISSSNLFQVRSKTKMISIFFDKKQQYYKVYCKLSFFDYDSTSKNYNTNQLSEINNLIIDWIR